MLSIRISLRLCCVALVLTVNLLGLAFAENDERANASKIQDEVRRLINLLGHPSYAQRSRARSELERMGLIAFDELHAAQTHEDSEIALQARYLVESLHVSWFTSEDSPDVREILDDYGNQSEVERKSRMDRLAALPDRDGLAALCRLVRFETKLRLSRSAAILIMQQEVGKSVESRQKNSEIIDRSLATNRREASQWLGTYAQDLRTGSYNVDAWRGYIQKERERVAGNTTKTTDDLVVMNLYRISAVRAKQMGLEQESLDLAFESLELVEGRKQPLRNATEWALDFEIWPVVLELYQREKKDFDSNAWLLYAVAEALTESGRPAEAEQLVVNAIDLAPIKMLNADGTSPMTTDQREQMVLKHVLVAVELIQRGRFKWAEREYRYIIDRSPVDSVSGADARLSLALMLGDSQRYESASEVLQPVVDRMLKDADFRRQVSRETHQDIDTYESRMFYYLAMSQIAKDLSEEARNSLRKAISAYPHDGDVIIAMYRLGGGDQWRLEVDRALRIAAAAFDHNIKTYERLNAGRQQNQLDEMIAFYCNQYAWLIANTEGDFQRALSYSQRSVELKPNSASNTDTLAHCYYALDKLESAVRTQRFALSLDPHSPPIKRQLRFFEAKLSEKQANKESDQDGDQVDR